MCKDMTSIPMGTQLNALKLVISLSTSLNRRNVQKFEEID